MFLKLPTSIKNHNWNYHCKEAFKPILNNMLEKIFLSYA